MALSFSPDFPFVRFAAAALADYIPAKANCDFAGNNGGRRVSYFDNSSPTIRDCPKISGPLFRHLRLHIAVELGFFGHINLMGRFAVA
jgi:hypothetical protein